MLIGADVGEVAKLLMMLECRQNVCFDHYDLGSTHQELSSWCLRAMNFYCLKKNVTTNLKYFPVSFAKDAFVV